MEDKLPNDCTSPILPCDSVEWAIRQASYGDVIRIAAEIQACNDIDTLFALITRTMSRLFRYDRASVAFLDPDDHKLRLRNIQKFQGHPVGENFLLPLDESNVIGWVVLNRSGILRNEIASDELIEEQLHSESLRSDMIVPMISGGSVLGTLNCGSLSPESCCRGFRPLSECAEITWMLQAHGAMV